MPKSQANTFNHPAAIWYLKGKETPHKQLFMNNIFMPAHAQACPRTTAADDTTKQSGLAPHPRSRTPAGPRTRTPAEALAALVSLTRLSSGPAVGFLAEPRLHLHQPGESLPFHSGGLLPFKLGAKGHTLCEARFKQTQET